MKHVLVFGRTLLTLLIIAVTFTLTGPVPVRAAENEKQSPSSSALSVRVTVDRKKIVGKSRLEIGVTHTRYSLDTGGDANAISRSKALLTDAGCRFQNVHIMGWGTMNPNPGPGVYDWESLDRRMAMVRSIPGAVPILTFCACPDWMKGGEPGKTDWSAIEKAPLPEHYQEFANLAATIARRYPDVRYFQVWNEMKGMWKASENNWDYQGYTDLYNRVYDALKQANPKNQVGGPYLVIEGTGGGKGPANDATNPPLSPRNRQVLTYWLQHKHGADFITLDRGLTSYHDKTIYTVSERMELAHWFGDIAQQVRKYPGAQTLPFWWAEFYPSSRSDTPALQTVLHALSYRSALLGGTSVVLLWQPMDTGEVGHALFTDARKPEGGNPLPLYAVVNLFHKNFPPGTTICASVSSEPKRVETLATADAVLLINKTSDPVTVTCWAGTRDEKTVRLASYAITVERSRTSRK